MSYQIISKLSEGGFSEVFEVRDPASALDEILILKRLTPEMSRRADVRRAFTREGEILSNLKHPNVVTFRRCYYEGDQICLLMEKIVGDQLNVWLHRHFSDSATALDVFRKILEAVDYLHHRATPLLHLDLKPENIVLESSADGFRPVLIDFGIARDLGHGGLKAFTPPYAAPEQTRGGQLGCFSDVFALGQILSEVLDRLTDLDAAERRELVAVADRARRSSRRQRYGDAGEMLRAFRRARFEASSSTEISSMSSRIQRAVAELPLSWILAGAGFATTLVLALVGLVAVIGSKPPPEPVDAVPTSAGRDSIAEENLCWKAVAEIEDTSILVTEFDRCARLALNHPNRHRVVAEFAAAKNFVDQQTQHLDIQSRQELQERLDSFRKNIDSRTRSTH